MDIILNFLDINNIFFSIWGYDMSYLEFFGTLLNILSVWLIARKNILSWPVGNVAVILFGILFYQVQLYSDLLEQVFFFITGFYGWWIWIVYSKTKDEKKGQIIYSNTRIYYISCSSHHFSYRIIRIRYGKYSYLVPYSLSSSGNLRVFGCLYHNHEFRSNIFNGAQEN